MPLALALICVALVGLLAYRERAAARRAEARSAQLGREIEIERDYTRKMLDGAEDERRRAEQERKELYQRIQAPDVAVAEAHRERRGPYVRRQPVGADDDARITGASRNGDREEVDGG